MFFLLEIQDGLIVVFVWRALAVRNNEVLECMFMYGNVCIDCQRLMQWVLSSRHGTVDLCLVMPDSDEGERGLVTLPSRFGLGTMCHHNSSIAGKTTCGASSKF